MSSNDADQLLMIRRVCHQLCASSCVNQKRHGLHVAFLKQRPHWSVLKKDEQFKQIDLGEKVPFDMALPLPARDPDKEDFDKIAERLGSKKKLKSLCRYDKDLKSWVLRQPCPFYEMEKKKCQIYEIRPLTCTKYPLHPPLREMPYNLAVDAFCPGARDLAKETLGWWIICENNWAKILSKLTRD